MELDVLGRLYPEESSRYANLVPRSDDEANTCLVLPYPIPSLISRRCWVDVSLDRRARCASEASARGVWRDVPAAAPSEYKSLVDERREAKVDRTTLQDLATDLRRWSGPIVAASQGPDETRELVANYVDYLDAVVNGMVKDAMIDYAWVSKGLSGMSLRKGYYNVYTGCKGHYGSLFLVWCLAYSFGLRTTGASIMAGKNAISTSMKLAVTLLPHVA